MAHHFNSKKEAQRQADILIGHLALLGQWGWKGIVWNIDDAHYFKLVKGNWDLRVTVDREGQITGHGVFLQNLPGIIGENGTTKGNAYFPGQGSDIIATLKTVREAVRKHAAMYLNRMEELG